MQKIRELIVEKMLIKRRISKNSKYSEEKLVLFALLSLLCFFAVFFTVMFLFIMLILLYFILGENEFVTSSFNFIAPLLTIKALLILMLSSPLAAIMHYIVKISIFYKIKHSPEKLLRLINKSYSHYSSYPDNICEYPEYYQLEKLFDMPLSKEELCFFSKEILAIKSKDQVENALKSSKVKECVKYGVFNVRYIWLILEHIEKEEYVIKNKRTEIINKKIPNIIFNI